MNDYEWNRNQGANAANKFLAQQHSAHGNHVQPRAHNTHDLGAYVHTDEDGQLAYPHPASAAERTNTTWEAKLAQNVQRRGTVQAAAGYAQRIPAIEDNFTGGFSDARSAAAPEYQARIAYGRSPLAGAPHAQPTWATPNVERSTPEFLGSAIANGELHKLSPRTQELRPGSTPFNHTRIDQLDLSSKPRQSYGYSMGTDDKQQVRRNEAEVRD